MRFQLFSDYGINCHQAKHTGLPHTTFSVVITLQSEGNTKGNEIKDLFHRQYFNISTSALRIQPWTCRQQPGYNSALHLNPESFPAAGSCGRPAPPGPLQGTATAVPKHREAEQETGAGEVTCFFRTVPDGKTSFMCENPLKKWELLTLVPGHQLAPAKLDLNLPSPHPHTTPRPDGPACCSHTDPGLPATAVPSAWRNPGPSSMSLNPRPHAQRTAAPRVAGFSTLPQGTLSRTPRDTPPG